MPPTVTIVSPTPGVPFGSPGGFSADWQVARMTPIVLEIDGADYECVVVTYAGELDERVIWRDGAFRGSFVARSASQVIGSVLRLTVLPLGGWPSSDALEDVVMSVDAIEITTAPTWSIDATRGIGVPADATEWGALISANSLGASAPSHLHLCQEPNGTLIDVIGTLDLPPTGAPLYGLASSGWSRVAVGGVGSAWAFAAAGGPNPSTTSFARLLYLDAGTLASGSQGVCANGTASNVGVSLLAGGLLRARGPGGLADTTQPLVAGTVYPVLHVFDVSNSRHRLYSSLEKISPAWGLGGSSTAYRIADSTVPAKVLYEAGWDGASAEALSTDANAKALLEALGWTVTGY